MTKRSYKIKKWDNYVKYFPKVLIDNNGKWLPIHRGELYMEHDNEYLEICYYNLKEKYIRGQKDFTKENFDRLKQFVESELGRKL